ncbi:hypothetical protein GF319_12895 [Candidatus Bathyarchaeota archaeon]|nr:hypothetical protein [Candidatus Bathyarchaeota archaeon]
MHACHRDDEPDDYTRLERTNNVTVDPKATLNDIKETIKDADILFGDWTRSIKITKEFLEAAYHIYKKMGYVEVERYSDGEWDHRNDIHWTIFMQKTL